MEYNHCRSLKIIEKNRLRNLEIEKGKEERKKRMMPDLIKGPDIGVNNDTYIQQYEGPE